MTTIEYTTTNGTTYMTNMPVPTHQPFARASEFALHHTGSIRRVLMNLCSNDQRLYQWVCKWLAFSVQMPGANMASALVVTAPAGAGKNVFFEAVIAQIHGEFARVRHPGDNKFTLDLVDASYLLIDEMPSRHSDHLAMVRSMLKCGYFVVTELGKQAKMVANKLNIVILASPDLPVPPLPSDGERRIVRLDCATVLPQSVYADVLKEVGNGGVEAFTECLLAVDLEGFHYDTLPPALTKGTNVPEDDGKPLSLMEERYNPVTRPKHYTGHPSGIECVQVTEHMSFLLGNVVKYLWRADAKGMPIEDLEKAAWYLNREIANRKSVQRKQIRDFATNIEKNVRPSLGMEARG